jgi:hypothetical protein
MPYTCAMYDDDDDDDDDDNDVAIPGDRTVIKKEAEKILKHKDLIIEVQRMWNVQTKVTPVITGNWNHFKILQKIHEQHTRKARNQGTTENSYIGHSTHTADSTNVVAQKSLILKTALYAPWVVSAE